MCLFLWLLFSIALIVKPSIFAKPNSSYVRYMLWWTGYDFKSKPVSQMEAERIVKKWGIISALFIVCLLILVYFLA